MSDHIISLSAIAFLFFLPINGVTITTVRVLLHTLSPNNAPITLSCPHGFIVQFSGITKHEKKNNLSITLKYDRIYLNGTPYKQQRIVVRPQKGAINFRKKTYQGSFTLAKTDKNLLLINNINIENYIHSVLKTESWPSWPLEAHKVMAIACRTYTISMILQARKNKKLYDVKNTNQHQTYAGTNSCSVQKKAVNQTKGMIVAYKKQPILAMYDSCCGGIIPSRTTNFDFSKHPYLARKYACSYCKGYKIYAWKTEFISSRFEKMITHHLRGKKKLTTLKITKKDKAGLVQKVALKGPGTSGNISGQQLYGLSKEIKSYCFDVSKKAGKIIFKGRGYGHHIGLCQWGAREMVRRGYNFKKIINFYYQKTYITQYSSVIS